MSKRLFILLITLMILLTASVLTLVLSGHEALVIEAFSWAVGVLSGAGKAIVIVALLLFTVWAVS